jgi:hypothetical protein
VSYCPYVWRQSSTLQAVSAPRPFNNDVSIEWTSAPSWFNTAKLLGGPAKAWSHGWCHVWAQGQRQRSRKAWSDCMGMRSALNAATCTHLSHRHSVRLGNSAGWIKAATFFFLGGGGDKNRSGYSKRGQQRVRHFVSLQALKAMWARYSGKYMYRMDRQHDVWLSRPELGYWVCDCVTSDKRLGSRHRSEASAPVETVPQSLGWTTHCLD